MKSARVARRLLWLPLLGRISTFILGAHPNNTIFAFNWHNVRHIRRFLRSARRSINASGITVADVGGGHAPYYPHFADLTKDYIVVDIQESMPANETRSIRQVPGTAEHIPLDDASVDLVLCNQVLEHVLDPVASMHEMYRILRPGSMILGSVPHVSPIHLEPHDYRRFTSLGLTKLLRDAKFENIHVEGSGGVFAAAALMISMDLLLSRRRDDVPQRFHSRLALVLAPVVAIMNFVGWLADGILGNRGRTPANLCWRAQKAHADPPSSPRNNQ